MHITVNCTLNVYFLYHIADLNRFKALFSLLRELVSLVGFSEKIRFLLFVWAVAEKMARFSANKTILVSFR